MSKNFIICCLLAAVIAESSLVSKGYRSEEKCPPGKVWSDLYEGGTCICPQPLEHIVKGNDYLSVHWDVVACAYIPNCPENYIWNALHSRCLCLTRLNCSSLCREKCGSIEECSKECDLLVFDPTKCECVKKCSNNVQCITGTHFDQDECKCVRNRCPVNIPCPKDSYFSDDCNCRYGKCPNRYNNNNCKHYEYFDHSICACVPDDRNEYKKCGKCERWNEHKYECVKIRPEECELKCGNDEHPNFLECACDPINTCYQSEYCNENEVFDHRYCKCMKNQHKYINDGCSNLIANLYYNYTLGLCQTASRICGSQKPNCCHVTNETLNCCQDGFCEGLIPCSGNTARNNLCVCSPKVCLPQVCLHNKIFDSKTCSCVKRPDLICVDGHYDESSYQCICKPHECEHTNSCERSYEGINCPGNYHKDRGGCCIPDNCSVGKIYSVSTDGCVCDPRGVSACNFGFDDDTCVCRTNPVACTRRDCGINGWQDPNSCCCFCEAGYHFNDSLPLGPRCVKDFCEQTALCRIGEVFNRDFCQCVPIICPIAPLECSPNFQSSTLCRCYCPQNKYLDLETNCCACIPKICPIGFIQDVNAPDCGCIPFICPLLLPESNPSYYGVSYHIRSHGSSYRRKHRGRVDFPCIKPFVYNEYTCRCQVGNDCCETECGGNNVAFDQRTCSCQCRDHTCIGGVFNDSTCRCDCPPRRDFVNGVCVCANNTFYNSFANDCQCFPINCTSPLTQSPATCGCECSINCALPHVLSRTPGVCACVCPTSLAEINLCTGSNGTFASNCQCICALGSQFDPILRVCVVCNQTVLCPTGFHFDSKLTCGCVPNYCPSVICPPGFQLNQVNCTCVPPCTNTCPLGTVRDNQTCACVAGLEVCSGLICPPGLVLNTTTCTCGILCPGVNTTCDIGFDFNPASCSCTEACGGQECAPSSIPGTYDYTRCACRRDCSNLAPCSDSCTVRNPYNECNCDPTNCADPGPRSICNIADGFYYNVFTCMCVLNNCTGVTCEVGVPDPSNSCLCLPPPMVPSNGGGGGLGSPGPTSPAIIFTRNCINELAEEYFNCLSNPNLTEIQCYNEYTLQIAQQCTPECFRLCKDEANACNPQNAAEDTICEAAYDTCFNFCSTINLSRPAQA